MNRRAIVVGSAGQDGTLLSSLLKSRGYSVTGVTRAGTTTSEGTSDPIDIGNMEDVSALVKQVLPDEIYFLAAFHHSSEDALGQEALLFYESNRVHFTAAIAFLEAIRTSSPSSRLFYAASSHVFGTPPTDVQDETTPLNPDSVYGITKTAGLLACRYYRQTHGLFASAGILYNHESSLRDEHFVSKKIAAGVARIRSGLAKTIVLGDLDAAVDWGYAPDFVDAMSRIMCLSAPQDFVVATGERHTVREFAKSAFNYVGLNYEQYVTSAPTVLMRPAKQLVGNPRRLNKATGWSPTVSFDEMVHRLVQAEVDALSA